MPASLTPPRPLELLLFMPELLLTAAGLVLLLAEMLSPRRPRVIGVGAVAFLFLALTSLAIPWHRLHAHVGGGLVPFFAPQSTQPGSGLPGPLTAFHGNWVVDGFALTMKAIILVGSILATLMGLRYADRFRNPGEFFALLVFATAAALLLTGAADLLMIYLSLEFLSITSYVLAGYLKFQPRSAEAALKYFLYGAITAAVMLYGLSLLYGMTGATGLYGAADGRRSFSEGLDTALARAGGLQVMLIALVMVTAGFGFKTAMAPFHQWVPDVYDGSPLPVMAWLSVASKAAGMAILVRVFHAAFPPQYWAMPVAVLAALTMTVGNLAALPQTNIKRMLAYSSIAHAGYTLMAVAALGKGGGYVAGTQTPSQWQMYGVAVYLATYVFMNLGALAVVTAVYDKIKSHRIEDYAGLSERAPGLAWLMVFFLLSLAGIPPTAGFWGKFVLFAGTIQTHLIWLAILGFINSVISVYYYWSVVRAMFLMKPAGTRAAGGEEGVSTTPEIRLTLAVAAVATLAIFLFAGQFMALFAL
jgi:NADH-quinone oxidoreductase subunit N